MSDGGRGGADRQDRGPGGAILRHLLAAYDDVVYRVHPSALTVVRRSMVALANGWERIMVRPYPPPTLAEVA